MDGLLVKIRFIISPTKLMDRKAFLERKACVGYTRLRGLHTLMWVNWGIRPNFLDHHNRLRSLCCPEVNWAGI